MLLIFLKNISDARKTLHSDAFTMDSIAFDDNTHTNEHKRSETPWDNFATLVVSDMLTAPTGEQCKDVMKDIMTLSSTRDSVLDNDVLDEKMTTSPKNSDEVS